MTTAPSTLPLKSSNTTATLSVVVIVLATIAAFWPVVKCDFTIWDDDATVSKNPYLNPPTFKGLLRYYRRPAMGLYIPVTYTVWAGIAYVSTPPLLAGGPMPDASLFHTANLVLHIGSAILVWLILRRLVQRNTFGISAITTPTPRQSEAPPSDHLDGPAISTQASISACAGALLFALHPVQVDSVAWVSGLKDVLAGFFSLIAIWQYICFVEATPKTLKRQLHDLAVIFATCGAIFSKPSATMLPLILFAIDTLQLGRPARQSARDLKWVVVCCILPMIAAAISQHPPTNVVFWKRPAVVLDALAFYAIKLVYPLHLAPDYARKPESIFRDNAIWFCWVIPLAVALLALLLRRRLPELLTGVCIFVAGLLPLLGFLSYLMQYRSNVADHYLYLPMLGVALAVAGLLARYSHVIGYALCGIVIAGAGFLSFRQIGFWQNSQTLFEHNLQVAPQSWTSHVAISNILVGQKKFPEAEAHARAAVDIFPAASNYALLGRLMLVQKRPNEAIKLLEKVVQTDPGWTDVRRDLASAYIDAGRLEDAVRELRAVLKADPSDDTARKMLDVADRMNRR